MSTLLLQSEAAREIGRTGEHKEALLPDTDAMKKGDIELSSYKGKILVRYRDLRGYSHRLHSASPDEANEYFQKCVNELRKDLEHWVLRR